MYSKFDEFIYKKNPFSLTMFLRFFIRYKYSQAGAVCHGHQNTDW
jgi:hypothetical protein